MSINILPTNNRGSHSIDQFGIDQYGIKWNLNSNGFRTIEFKDVDFIQPRAMAMGCSHTMGDGNNFEDSWPEILKDKINFSQIINLGQLGASSDYVVRILPQCLEYFKPEVVFIFWPDYVRFEVFVDGEYKQIVPSDDDRILYIESHNEEMLKEKYADNLKAAQELCEQYNAKLIGIDWDDLIPVLDHADKWNRGADRMHYDKVWHNGVAETFKQIYNAK